VFSENRDFALGGSGNACHGAVDPIVKIVTPNPTDVLKHDEQMHQCRMVDPFGILGLYPRMRFVAALGWIALNTRWY